MVTKSYPFHPELIRVLDKRLGNITEFQRARGALKLLAEVVANIYATNDNTAIINVGDIDYSNEPVLNHLTDGLGRAEYASVAKGDFASKASHAAVVDADVFPGKPAYATRVARTVFTHSLEMVSTAGAGRNDWLVGTLRPGEDATIFEKALTESEKVFWHLSYDGARWRFNIEPNVNAIIETEKRNVANTAVAAEVDSLIKKAFANDGGVTAIHFPSGPAEIPDKDALRVVVLDHDVVTVDPAHVDQPPAQIIEMLDKVGSVGTPRKYRNSLVFALADAEQIHVLKDRARALSPPTTSPPIPTGWVSSARRFARRSRPTTRRPASRRASRSPGASSTSTTRPTRRPPATCATGSFRPSPRATRRTPPLQSSPC